MMKDMVALRGEKLGATAQSARGCHFPNYVTSQWR